MDFESYFCIVRIYSCIIRIFCRGYSCITCHSIILIKHIAESSDDVNILLVEVMNRKEGKGIFLITYILYP